MFVHKVEERLAKDISILQAEYDVLGPTGRNQYNESREAIAAELDLLKRLAVMIEQFNQRRMRQVTDRMWRNND
ncbi:MAG TPA: hypothetical protein VFF64_24365 [Candidatus Eremiobacteraceae bacterium]|nr:hypothetical protein [Candidatus Eremiobacteraceae bacterium]